MLANDPTPRAEHDRELDDIRTAFATDADRCDCNRFAPRACTVHPRPFVPEWRRRALADHARRGNVATHALDRS